MHVHESRWFLAFFILILLVALGACATPSLDTTNKRVTSAELAIEGMLDQIDQYEEEGRFTDEEWEDIVERLKDLRATREAMKVVLEAGEDPGPTIATAYRILEALRPYVVEDSARTGEGADNGSDQ